MKKYQHILVFIGILTIYSTATAQSISHYFVQMPEKMIPTVKVETRKDLVDFFKNGKSAVMPAAIGGEIILKEMSEDYLLLQTSESADLQLKLLQINDSLRVIAVVTTVAAPLKNSLIQFYSTLWEPLHNIAFPQFTYLNFLDVDKAKTLGLADRFNEVSLRNFVAYKFQKDSPQMVVYTSLRKDISPEAQKDFESVLKDSLTYDWNQGFFYLQKFGK